MPIGYAIAIGLVFGLWGLLGSKVNGGAWTAPVVMAATVIAALYFGRKTMTQTIPQASAFMWLTVAGLLNGWACCKFASILATLGPRGGLFGAIVSVCIAASAVLWALLFFRTVPDLRQFIGILLGAAAIWLLTAK